MKHTLTALLQDRPGALNRTVSLFRRRGFNIESLSVAPSETPGLSRVTIVVDEPNIDRVVKQFTRLIEVVDVSETVSRGTGDGAREGTAPRR
jgi:acetolactate synthase-1/3 small subunit